MTTMVAAHEHIWVATVTEDGERVIDWEAALGSRSVPILSPIPEPCSLAGRGAVAAYLVDFSLLPEGALLKITRMMARQAGVSTAEVLGDLAIEKALPIVADGVRVSTSCCDFITGHEAENGTDEGYQAWLRPELLALRDDEELMSLEVRKLDALMILGALQLAVKHPGLTDEPLATTIGAAMTLQGALCPPGSALERLALLGWTGR